MPHEIVTAFADVGLALAPTLCEMLDEHPAHRTERRGCGYTQATRFLAARINGPRDPLDAGDLCVFGDWPRTATEALARQAARSGWMSGWRSLDQAPASLLAECSPSSLAATLAALPGQIDAVSASLALEESRLLVAMLRDLLLPVESEHPALPVMLEKPEIGSCSQAEEFFLEIAHGRVRRGGRVNVFVDAALRPILVEKVGLGESHSAMFVTSATVSCVCVPPGGLCALRYSDEAAPMAATRHGNVFPLSVLEEVRFLRLTTLAVSPSARQRAFTAQFDTQVRNDMLSPRTTTIEDLLDYATSQLKAA